MNGKLSLGPLLYNWSAEKARDFYLRVADEMDVDRVFIGEVVCSKRQPLHAGYITEVVERLQRAGKQVILSSLALVMSDKESKGMQELCATAENMLVELNDVSLVQAMQGKPFAAGPYVNIYNEGTLRFFEEAGACLVILPFELPRSTLQALAARAKAEMEIQVFGRLPLALSARCYHARVFHLQKDHCQFVCDKHPDGMEVKTMDGERFLAVNGTQTQSQTYANLLQEIPDLQSIGIRNYRLSPHALDMVAVAAVFRSVQRGLAAPEEVLRKLGAITGGLPFSNGFYHGTVGKRLQLA